MRGAAGAFGLKMKICALRTLYLIYPIEYEKLLSFARPAGANKLTIALMRHIALFSLRIVMPQWSQYLMFLLRGVSACHVIILTAVL